MIFLCRWVEVSLRWKKGGVMVACDFVKWECWSCSSDTGVKYEQIFLEENLRRTEAINKREESATLLLRFFFFFVRITSSLFPFFFFLFFRSTSMLQNLIKVGPFLVCFFKNDAQMKFKSLLNSFKRHDN